MSDIFAEGASASSLTSSFTCSVLFSSGPITSMDTFEPNFELPELSSLSLYPVIKCGTISLELVSMSLEGSEPEGISLTSDAGLLNVFLGGLQKLRPHQYGHYQSQVWVNLVNSF